jgi:hypothetical protein
MKTLKEVLSLITGKGFEKTGEGYYTYLLTDEELQEYFLFDADRTDLIESGQVKAALLEVYPDREEVNYILFEAIPTEQDIVNANIIYEDDFDGFMEWLQG